jgi:hypothetical protein
MLAASTGAPRKWTQGACCPAHLHVCLLVHITCVQADFNGPAHAPVLLQKPLNCTGNETSLADCASRSEGDCGYYGYDEHYGTGGCPHDYDVAVACADHISLGAVPGPFAGFLSQCEEELR